MVKPIAKTQAYLLHPWLVRAHHEWYDTTQETQTPDVIRRSTSYHVQWNAVQKSVEQFFYDRRMYWVPATAYALYALVASPVMMFPFIIGALSYVGSTGTAIREGGGHATITNFTFTHDATGADILALGVTADSSTTTVTATYNSASLTQAILSQATDRRSAWIGYKGSPSSGSNTVSVTYGTGTAGFGVAATYSGTAGTMSGGTGSNGTTQNYSTNVTTTNGDMAFDVSTNGGTQTVTAGSGQTARLTGNDSYWHYARASEKAATTTTTTMTWNRGTGAANFVHAVACINQAVASSSTVKTWNGLAKASIKTYNGLA